MVIADSISIIDYITVTNLMYIFLLYSRLVHDVDLFVPALLSLLKSLLDMGDFLSLDLSRHEKRPFNFLIRV